MTESPNKTARCVRRRLLAAVAAGLSVGLLAGHASARESSLPTAAPVSGHSSAASEAPGLRADFGGSSPSGDARQVADWVVRTGDNQHMPFIIVDKKHTRVFVFDGQARLRGATAALLGLAIGDDSSPGVGSRPLAAIAPGDRTTPAGRFVASLGRNIDNQTTLWIDYETALALHQVRGPGTRQHRLERLGATSPLSRRITFGCINVPVSFYDDIVHPEFVGTAGIVYILPDTKSIDEVFLDRSAHS